MRKMPGSLDERMFAVVEAIFDAAMDESRLPEALQELMDCTGSQAASFGCWTVPKNLGCPLSRTLTSNPNLFRNTWSILPSTTPGTGIWSLIEIKTSFTTAGDRRT
jgi:hypothetical protein